MTRARTVLLVAALSGLMAGPAWALKVGRISLDSSDGRLLLKIQTDGQAHAKLQLLKGKVLVVIPGGQRSLATLKLGGDPVKRIRFGRDGADLHVVLDLSRDVKASLAGQDATGISVDLGPSGGGKAAAAKPAADEAADAKPADDNGADSLNPALAGYTSRIVDVALDGDDAHSELVISADGPASYKPTVREGGRLFSVLFRNSALAWSGDAGKLKDNAIESVGLHQVNTGGEAQVRVDVRLTAKLDYTVQRDQNQLVLRFVRPAKSAPAPKAGDLNTPVSLDVQDADLVSVLKALCDQAGFEYQFTPGILAVAPPSSLVTIKVLDRPFYEVANTLLVGVKANFVQQGNSLIFGMQADVDAAKAELPVVQRVYVPKNVSVTQALNLLPIIFKRTDQDTLAHHVAAADPRDTTRLLLSGSAEDVAQVLQGLAKVDVGDNGEGGDSEPGDNAMRTQVYIIRYVSLSSNLIQSAIQQLFPPALLTDPDNKPQVLSDPTTHSLVVTTQMKYHRKIQKLINRLDIRPIQVNIEGKIVEVDDNVSQQLGIDWNTSSKSQAPIGYSNNGATVPGPNTTGNFNTNAPTDFTSALTYATLQNGYNIAARIQALVNASKADLVSAPNITTNDMESALISSTDNVVIQTTTTTFSNGASQSTVTSSQLPLTLSLNVLPRVAKEDRRIYMLINFQLQSQTGNAPAGSSLPPTSTQQASTEVNVASGETAVIGGMVRQSVTSTEGKVPVLGDIPLLGMLFRFKSDSKVKREVIIFITPSIVED